MSSESQGCAATNGELPAGVASALAGDLLDTVLAEQRRDWIDGKRPPVVDWLRRYPALASDPELAAELVYHEFILREELGESPDWEDYLQRFPQQAAALRLLQQADQIVEQVYPARVEPAVRSTDQFGDYELLEEIGRGGMGVVYKVRQKGLKRLAALKMILAGQFASPADVLRFQTEAENAACLDHPHVVPIYDIGEHDGRHYFSMKLMEGGSLAKQASHIRQDPRAAARLVATVARAVHYAHQRGILHRDLKPANILLDDKGEPHVTDFGLAKRIEAGSSPSPSGAVIGTPSYMAPEQVRGARSLSTAADIYSLGAVFYELLTGTPPFREDTVTDILLAVQDREPARPRALDARLDRDLETVCLKCLEKDPQKRYGSAEALAEDLERWLNDEPIEARPVGTLERCWRRCRRYPAVTALAAILTVAVLTGLLTSFGLWQKAETNAARAVESEQHALERLQAEHIARQGEQAALRESEEGKQAILQVLAAHVEIGRVPQTPESLRQMTWRALKEAETTYQSLLRQPGQSDALQMGLAEVYLVQGALLFQTGRRAEAQAALENALQLWESLARQTHGSPACRDGLARTHGLLGHLHLHQGRAQQSLHAFQKAYALRQEQAGEQNSSSERFQLVITGIEVCRLLSHAGRRPEAGRLLKKNRELLEDLVDAEPAAHQDRRYLALTCLMLGDHHDQDGNPDQALRYWQQAYDHYNRLTGLPPSQRPSRELADCCRRLGRAQPDGPYQGEAIQILEQAAASYAKLSEEDPANAAHCQELAASHHDLGEHYGETGQPVRAAQAYERAVQFQETLAKRHPAEGQFHLDLARFYRNLARNCQEAGDSLKAAQAILRGMEVLDELSSRQRADGTLDTRLLKSLQEVVGTCVEKLDQPAISLELARKAAAVLTRHVASPPRDEEGRHQLALYADSVGYYLCALGEPAEGLSCAKHSQRMFEALAREAPAQLRYQIGLSRSWDLIAKAHFKLGEFEKALPAWERSVDVQRKVIALAPAVVEHRQRLGDRCLRLGRDLRERGRLAEAEAWFREFGKLWPDDAEKQSELSREFQKLADAAAQRRKEPMPAGQAWR